MTNLSRWLCAIVLVAFGCFAIAAQEDEVIRADNLERLRPAARIDFADFPDELQIGWFEANGDASEFIVFDGAGRIYRVRTEGIIDSWTYREDEAQIFSVLDAVYVDDEPLLLYLLDGAYFLNDRHLRLDSFPVAVYKLEDAVFVEAITHDGATVFHEVALETEADTISPVKTLNLPGSDSEVLGVLIGRIDFPFVLLSRLADKVLTAYRYPDEFGEEPGREYRLAGGPAVAGAINSGGSHFAWGDPESARLNLLDLASGENAVVAELGGAYAQYHLLTQDASVILAVNVDFAPETFAWEVETGRRHDLGAYRECTRIPDKVALSEDGRALLIGCDTGLEIWRIYTEEG